LQNPIFVAFKNRRFKILQILRAHWCERHCREDYCCSVEEQTSENVQFKEKMNEKGSEGKLEKCGIPTPTTNKHLGFTFSASDFMLLAWLCRLFAVSFGVL